MLGLGRLREYVVFRRRCRLPPPAQLRRVHQKVKVQSQQIKSSKANFFRRKELDQEEN